MKSKSFLIFMLMIIGLILASLVIAVNTIKADDLKEQEYMINKIEKLLEERPDNWYITNDSLFYCPDKSYIKNVSELPYPEHSAYTEIVIEFRLMRGSRNSYISFEKPELELLSNYDHKNQVKVFRKIDKMIKVLLYKQLKKEVGLYVENMEEKEVPKEEPKISEPVEIKEGRADGLKAL